MNRARPTISFAQLDVLMRAPAPKRYEHFIKQVADWGEAWGLYMDGWALASTADGTTVFPLWPAREYAALSAEREWEGYEPTPISLPDLRDELLPKLKKDGVVPGVFYTPTDKGITPSIDQLIHDLEAEAQQYE